ncbi:MAG: bifunctional phosphoribosylaminoimidazolecarboxamide formyltransferase/IMP cyclohydrolase [Rhodospirillales bacterium]|nr:bifunctional phosphoribosylaminoimidazolecarboxamide formyltransferase/IMP cyclohydrolase [Rhodospirillales bacterium]HIJ43824.1 bifunctional phosphoribosylaminoimidazolecarboxamide formyltransferase/IMP cyclohydrolase [Rhodospirillaceae bacterium]HIJ93905.1 bifunctional phosphoribosylaminoimidazolecarboxamide formyltransferase/IMP cyclohydrolase [Rhodospirillaceae bacterium]HJP53947.1 bifunctional phosphoribosylaminoimidazolecarboxamide formyltransferase/IMP cyclohydrolase [Rhodospirillales 
MPPPSSSRIRRALISVSDKTDLVEFGRFLSDNGIEVLSTGGTANVLRDAGVQVTEVSDHTGFPEILDGRVKTLQPLIHGGLLAKRGDPDHQRAMDELGIAPIDLLAVNLYPFEATVAEGADFDACVENIDIGGPAMIRAAAKNHESVTVVVDPADYGIVMKEMKANGGATTASFRKRLAAKAYARTGAYDAAIGGWFNEQVGETFPDRIAFGGKLGQIMRHGENPHQLAAFYRGGECRPGVASAEQIQGKELSYNNFNDTDTAFELVAEFEPTALAIIKHANPCGVAVSATLVDSYAMALACDPESAFGGIVACNRALDAATAEEIVKLFTEVVIAPEVDPAARKILAAKENLRVLVTGAMPDAAAPGMSLKSLAGGFLLQGRDNAVLEEMKVVTRRAPTEAEMADLEFAFTVCKHVKSNAIVYAKNKVTVGIGGGQTSRVNSSRVAAWKAEDTARAAGEKTSRAAGSVVASDAFFPFADGLLAAAGAGVTAIIQPGGSRRDDEVIAAADERGLAMVFTGMRHFRH